MLNLFHYRQYEVGSLYADQLMRTMLCMLEIRNLYWNISKIKLYCNVCICIVSALNIAFGSLYHDDVAITPSQVTHVLAAGTLLNLEGLISQCSEIMKETIR